MNPFDAAWTLLKARRSIGGGAMGPFMRHTYGENHRPFFNAYQFPGMFPQVSENGREVPWTMSSDPYYHEHYGPRETRVREKWPDVDTEMSLSGVHPYCGKHVIPNLPEALSESGECPICRFERKSLGYVPRHTTAEGGIDLSAPYGGRDRPSTIGDLKDAIYEDDY